MHDLLFVYGTLRRASPHPMARFLEARSTLLGPGKIAARLYDVGGVPGIVPARNAKEWVFGEAVRLHAPSEMLPELDRYEGCDPEVKQPWLYERKLSEVRLDDGATVTAWVYVYLDRVEDTRRITSGVYPV